MPHPVRRAAADAGGSHRAQGAPKLRLRVLGKPQVGEALIAAAAGVPQGAQCGFVWSRRRCAQTLSASLPAPPSFRASFPSRQPRPPRVAAARSNRATRAASPARRLHGMPRRASSAGRRSASSVCMPRIVLTHPSMRVATTKVTTGCDRTIRVAGDGAAARGPSSLPPPNSPPAAAQPASNESFAGETRRAIGDERGENADADFLSAVFLFVGFVQVRWLRGRGLHSSTSQLNLSPVRHKTDPTCSLVPPNPSWTSPRQPLNAPPIPQKALKLS
jgi:hypothetical protein